MSLDLRDMETRIRNPRQHDAQGRIVLSQAFDSSTKTQIISLANLSPATYTVNLLDVKGALIDKGAIIVNR